MDHIWYWFAYSFFGYCLEKLFAAATSSSHRLRRCFVFLPLCPVYGLAMLAVLALRTEDLPHLWERMALSVFAATAVEYVVHWGYEKVFGGGGKAPRRVGADLARYARGDGDGIRRALGL